MLIYMVQLLLKTKEVVFCAKQKAKIMEAIAKILEQDNLSFRVKREIFYNQ